MQTQCLEKIVQDFLRELGVRADDGIIVAVSGGADSMALLCALQQVQKTVPFHMLAAHVHHGLRADEADADMEFLRGECAKRNIPLEILQADVKTEAIAGEGVEQAGRRIRYAFFERLRAQYGYRYVATAHHADDNLETVLLHLTRGSGLHGLCGISPCNNDIIRPLLTCTRAEIEAYCAEKSIPYVTDSTNTDTAYSRNRVRRLVVPQLQVINPQVVEACTRLTADLREEDAFLLDLAQQVLLMAACDKDAYKIKSLLDAAAPLRRRALKLLLEQKGSDCEQKHIALLQMLLEKGQGAVQAPDGVTVIVKDDVLRLQKADEQRKVPPLVAQSLVMGKAVELAGTVYMPCCVSRSDFVKKQKVYKKVLQYACDYDKLNGDLMVRGRQMGDTFHPVGGAGKTLKKYFNEKRVPLGQRMATPVVCDKKGIVLLAGFSCDNRVRLDETTKRVFLLCPMDIYEEEKSSEYTYRYCGNSV